MCDFSDTETWAGSYDASWECIRINVKETEVGLPPWASLDRGNWNILVAFSRVGTGLCDTLYKDFRHAHSAWIDRLSEKLTLHALGVLDVVAIPGHKHLQDFTGMYGRSCVDNMRSRPDRCTVSPLFPSIKSAGGFERVGRLSG